MHLEGTGPFLTLQRRTLGLQNAFPLSEGGRCIPLGLGEKIPPFPETATPVVDSQGASAGEGIGLPFAPAISSLSCHYLDSATQESGLVPTVCLVIF